MGRARITRELSAFSAGFVVSASEVHAKNYISALIAF
jgi:hypothetical protein